MTQKWDVVIVGGGLAGYVAANYLSKTNLSILIVEKGKHVGGRAGTTKLKQQYLNLGPHALYKKGKAVSILEELGIHLPGKSPKLNGILIENNIEYAAPLSPFELFTTRLFNGKERIEWLAALLKLMNTDPDKLAAQTFQQWVKQITHSKIVESLLYVLGRLSTYCHAPERVSAKVMVSNMKNAMGGALYLDGGWQTSSIYRDALLELISENVTLYSDGGGKVTAAVRPVVSVSNVLALLYGVIKKAPKDSYFEVKNVNHQPAIVIYMNGTIHSILSFYIHHEKIIEMYITMNPDKLPVD